jgi:1,4-dihydroxy-2-naphthoate octaprenyltransferase
MASPKPDRARREPPRAKTGLWATLGAWVRAARPLAQANMAAPIAVGVAYAAGMGAPVEGWMLATCAAFSVLDHLFIVFANDYADRHTDTLERTLFSGGSGVLVEGALKPASVRRAALLSAGGLLWLGAWTLERRPLLLIAAVAALALLQLYSYRPARLSFRGGGELLQGLGLGVVLPFVGDYVVRADASGPSALFLPMFLWGVAGNITTAIPDVDADRAAQKRTLAVTLGEARARLLGTGLLLASVGSALWMFREVLASGRLVALAATCVPLLSLARYRSRFAYAFVQGGVLMLFAATLAFSLGSAR